MKTKTKKTKKKETAPAVLLSQCHDVSVFAAGAADGVQGALHYHEKARCIEATNGKLVVRVPVDVQQVYGGYSMPMDCLIDKTFVADNVKGSETRTVLETIPPQHKDEAPQVRLTQFATVGSQTKTWVCPPGIFPRTDPFFETDQKRVKVTISAKMLKALADYAKKNGYYEAVQFGIEPPQKGEEHSYDPVEFRIMVNSTIEARGFFMPMHKHSTTESNGPHKRTDTTTDAQPNG